MAIVASGEISLGGNATATRSVACELARSGTAAICMNENAVRTLAQRTTAASAICMNNFYGKSNFPTVFGTFYNGGYYTAVQYINCSAYHLLIAPNATGCANCAWRTNSALTNNSSNATCNCDNGYWNTFTYLNNVTHPAGNWAATRSIGGFSDWYLPAYNELNILYTNKGCMPAGEGYNEGASYYWTSTEQSNNYAFFQRFCNGTFGFDFKSFSCPLRAVRRDPFTPSAPTALGQYIHGGYYTGTITSPANYYLIVAPNATGCACCQSKTSSTCTNMSSDATCNYNNGYWNTFTYLNNATHPAGNWAATRSIGGFSDWYLPALNELNVLYTNKGSMPAGEGYSSSMYWTSTEYTTLTWYQCMNTGYNLWQFKNTSRNIRAVRRVAF